MLQESSLGRSEAGYIRQPFPFCVEIFLSLCAGKAVRCSGRAFQIPEKRLACRAVFLDDVALSACPANSRSALHGDCTQKKRWNLSYRKFLYHTLARMLHLLGEIPGEMIFQRDSFLLQVAHIFYV